MVIGPGRRDNQQTGVAELPCTVWLESIPETCICKRSCRLLSFLLSHRLGPLLSIRMAPPRHAVPGLSTSSGSCKSQLNGMAS